MSARPARPRGLAAVVALAAVLALGGCGLRLETPPPVEPSPDATEQVRAAAVDDALTLAALATAALTTAAGPAEAVAAVLDDTVAFSTRHADELGGRYDSGLPEPTPTPTGTPSAAPTAEPDEVLVALVETAGTALTAADQVPDGAMALLLASIGTAREQLAGRLAAALGVPVPTPPGSSPSPDPTATATTTATAAAPGVASPTPASSATSSAPADAGPGLPDGLDRATAVALITAHDEAAYGFEVIAAKLSGDQRALAWAAALTHRDDADAWTTRAGLADTADDPRRPDYAVPTGMDDPAVATALAARLEVAVADASAVAIASTTPGSRAELIDTLRTATADSLTWGATPLAFPGMPELGTVAAG